MVNGARGCAEKQGGLVMLALLAVFGALGAGVMADAFLSSKSTGSDAEGEPSEAEDEAPDDDPDLGSMFDHMDQPPLTMDADPMAATGFQSGHVENGMPVSDDVADETDDPMRISGSAGDDILSTGDGDDALWGRGGEDQLTGRGGDDVMNGGLGNDHLDGDDGDDRMSGGMGNDSLNAGDGDDTLHGGVGNDALAGQDGDDLIRGGSGHDTLMGGDGEDTLDGGMGRDWLAGGAGHDQMVGGGSQDTLDGGDGDDTLWGGSSTAGDMAVDFLNGGAGDDVLHLGAGDYGMGGAGADSFVLQDIYPGGPMAEISDYNPAEDKIVVMYDPAVHAAPELAMVPVEGSDDVTLTLDGVKIAMVRGGIGMDLSQVTLRAA